MKKWLYTVVASEISLPKGFCESLNGISTHGLNGLVPTLVVCWLPEVMRALRGL